MPDNTSYFKLFPVLESEPEEGNQNLKRLFSLKFFDDSNVIFISIEYRYQLYLRLFGLDNHRNKARLCSVR